MEGNVLLGNIVGLAISAIGVFLYAWSVFGGVDNQRVITVLKERENQ